MTQLPLANTLFQFQDFAEPNLLFVFGVFLTLGVLGAVLAHRLRWLPTITSFMLLGMIIGPSGMDFVDARLPSDLPFAPQGSPPDEKQLHPLPRKSK